MFSVVSTLASMATAAHVAPFHAGDGSAPDGDFIVVFWKNTTAEQRASHLTATHGAELAGITRQFNIKSFHGYAATLSTEALASVRADGVNVEFVEADQIMKASAPVSEKLELHPAPKSAKQCSMQLEATWGLVRTGERALNINGEYAYDEQKTGQGVDAYIIDTGIMTTHVEFEGRARWGFDAVDRPSPETDSNGHGTHCAGTVGAKNYGIAKNVNLVAVKVLGASGSGSTAGVIDGIDWTCTDHEAKKNKCVANMSLGGGYSLAMNRAVDAAVECGCSVAVASGNDARDACNYSPASADNSVSVNSMTSTDIPSSFSNYGTCSDIYAPGSSITSTWIGSNFAINTISGTSMAAPHVCGVMALEAQKAAATPAQIKANILAASTPDVLSNVKRDTPNKLLYAPCAV